jgi:large subunit ribosomal protein L15
VRLSELNSLTSEIIDLKALIQANVVPIFTKTVKVIKSGSLTKAIVLKGIKVTVGAKEAIQSAGGRIEV